MAVTSSSDTKLNTFITTLKRDYPKLKFRRGERENWSARSRTVTYNPNQDEQQLKFGLLHELAHAILEHNNYSSDMELLKLEAEAWNLAAKLAPKYGVKISDDHIQKCLDTYRDWLHKRSACPNCGVHVIQTTPELYKCFNCQTVWQVSHSRFARPYRLMKNPNH